MLSIGILDPNPGLKGRARARFSRRPPAPGEKRGVDALRLTQRSPRRVLSWRSQRARRDTAGSPSGAASGVSGYEAGASTRANLERPAAHANRPCPHHGQRLADGGRATRRSRPCPLPLPPLAARALRRRVSNSSPLRGATRQLPSLQLRWPCPSPPAAAATVVEPAAMPGLPAPAPSPGTQAGAPG